MAGIYSKTRTPLADIASDSVSPLYHKDLLSIKDLTLSEIEAVLDLAAKLKAAPKTNLLDNKIIASCFFEPSTRTRLSFESATLRLGGKVIGFSDANSLSTKKGETLKDTMRVMADYADLLIMRHPQEGAARLAADICDVPVINAGDGANQHPTQTLIDLFSIKECQGKLEELSIALVGDLKYGRTIHSLVQACQLFNIRLFLVAPESLTLSESVCDYLKRKSVRFSFHKSLKEIIHKVDVVYMTRVQKERIPAAEYRAAKSDTTLTKDMLQNAKPAMRVLHPLPRVNELDVAIDDTPNAYYFQQAANGVFVRQAILTMMLNQDLV